MSNQNNIKKYMNNMRVSVDIYIRSYFQDKTEIKIKADEIKIDVLSLDFRSMESCKIHSLLQ